MKITILSTALATAAMMFVACDQSGASDKTARAKAASVSEEKPGKSKDEPAASAHAGTIAVDKNNFDEVVLKSELPVLVDYGAEWCGPCKIVAPIVEEIAEEYSGKLVVATLDVDVAGDIATGYGVQTLPTLMVFKNGNPVDTVPMNGLPTKADIVRVLEKHF